LGADVLLLISRSDDYAGSMMEVVLALLKINRAAA
jgi:hypothetical protein